MDQGSVTDPVKERLGVNCTVGSTTAPGPPSNGKTWTEPFPLEADAAAICPPPGSTANGNVNGARSSGLNWSESTQLGTTTTEAQLFDTEKAWSWGVSAPPSATAQ